MTTELNLKFKIHSLSGSPTFQIRGNTVDGRAFGREISFSQWEDDLIPLDILERFITEVKYEAWYPREISFAERDWVSNNEKTTE